jgi:hypothetical protein
MGARNIGGKARRKETTRKTKTLVGGTGLIWLRIGTSGGLL